MADDLTEEELEYLRSMFDLARDGDTEALVAALDRGVPTNLSNAKGDTLLILATYHGHTATVRALLERGADVTRVKDNGQTALAAAVFRNSAENATLLLDAGADPRQGPRTALEVAQVFDLPEMLALLTSRD